MDIGGSNINRDAQSGDDDIFGGCKTCERLLGIMFCDFDHWICPDCGSHWNKSNENHIRKKEALLPIQSDKDELGQHPNTPKPVRVYNINGVDYIFCPSCNTPIHPHEWPCPICGCHDIISYSNSNSRNVGRKQDIPASDNDNNTIND